MADKYVVSGLDKNIADFSALIADGNAINAATKTALNTAITNINNLLGPVGSANLGAAHPDFNKIPPVIRGLLHTELTQLMAVITAHA